MIRRRFDEARSISLPTWGEATACSESTRTTTLASLIAPTISSAYCDPGVTIPRRDPALDPLPLESLYQRIGNRHVLRRVAHEYVAARSCVIGGVFAHSGKFIFAETLVARIIFEVPPPTGWPLSTEDSKSLCAYAFSPPAKRCVACRRGMHTRTRVGKEMRRRRCARQRALRRPTRRYAVTREYTSARPISRTPSIVSSCISTQRELRWPMKKECHAHVVGTAV